MADKPLHARAGLYEAEVRYLTRVESARPRPPSLGITIGAD
jgi:hypothetical protein